MNRNNSSASMPRKTGLRRSNAFTLIELLTVISIIAVLAGLTVGLVTVAGRKSKESRVSGEMSRLIAEIENYKAKLGFYPPDNARGNPSTNQLYYELSGSLFQQGPPASFKVISAAETILASTADGWFGADGFANSARNQRDVRHRTEFKSSQYAEVSATPDVEVLKVPVDGPAQFNHHGTMRQLVFQTPRGKLNPWLYDSSSTNRYNQTSYDLWCEVVIARKIIRFSNWEPNPVVLRPDTSP